MASKTFFNFFSIAEAMCSNSELPIIFIATVGLIIETTVLFRLLYIATLQGSINPIFSSTRIASWALGGLHAPNIMYFSKSIPSFSLNFSATSICVRIPKPSFFNSFVTLVIAYSSEASISLVNP